MIDTHVDVLLYSSPEDLDAILYMAGEDGKHFALVFCQSCVQEMACMFGMIGANQAASLYDEIECMTAAYQDQATKLANAQEAARVLLQATNGAFGQAPVEKQPPPVYPASTDPEMFPTPT